MLFKLRDGIFHTYLEIYTLMIIVQAKEPLEVSINIVNIMKFTLEDDKTRF